MGDPGAWRTPSPQQAQALLTAGQCTSHHGCEEVRGQGSVTQEDLELVVSSEVDGGGGHSHHPGEGTGLRNAGQWAQGLSGKEREGTLQQGEHSQRGWEAAPQGPGAFMPHNLHKSVLPQEQPQGGNKHEQL